MNRKFIVGGIALAALVGIPIAYWLVSPLFITREVNEELAKKYSLIK